VDLALCYWREGAIDEARVTLDDALRRSVISKASSASRSVESSHRRKSF